MKKAEHFKIYELVPPSVYEKYGERAWWFIDESLIALIDAMREQFGSATINDYKWGGKYSQSGFRTAESQYYNPFSQHAMGRAVDLKFRDYTANEVRAAMLINPEKWLKICPSITLEEDVSWVHVDVRNGDNCIRTFKP